MASFSCSVGYGLCRWAAKKGYEERATADTGLALFVAGGGGGGSRGGCGAGDEEGCLLLGVVPGEEGRRWGWRETLAEGWVGETLNKGSNTEYECLPLGCAGKDGRIF